MTRAIRKKKINVAAQNSALKSVSPCAEEGGGQPVGGGGSGSRYTQNLTASPGLAELSSKSPSFTFVSLRHLFLRGTAGIFFPRDGEFFPSSILNHQCNVQKERRIQSNSNAKWQSLEVLKTVWFM